jgi:hypothetical protein
LLSLAHENTDGIPEHGRHMKELLLQRLIRRRKKLNLHYDTMKQSSGTKHGDRNFQTILVAAKKISTLL